MAPSTTDLDYAVVHQTSKRLRIQVPRLRSDEALAATLQSRLEAVKGVVAVRMNRAACSVIVHFRDRPSADPVISRILDLLEGWSLPTSEPALEQASALIAQHPKPPASTPAAPPSPRPDRSTDIANPADGDQPAVTLPEPLTQRDLAERLGVASQSITPRRQQPTFQDWSQEQDPEGIAWCYRPESGTFHPLSEINLTSQE
ncbi:HMA2 domain-containing protein [Thermoleptolyngbya sp.]